MIVTTELKKSDFFAPAHEDMNVKVHFKQTCQIVVSALLGNLSECPDNPQESTATVQTARAMLINIFPCEYHTSSQSRIVEEIQT